MHALPALIAAALAVALAAPLLGAMSRGGHVRENYRGRLLAFPFGVLVPAAAIAALALVAFVQWLGAGTLLDPDTAVVAVYCFGVAALGLIDDALGGGSGLGSGGGHRSTPPRGVRAHAAAALRGERSTGAIKAFGTTALAVLVATHLPATRQHWLLAAAVLVLATHFFNLLDLRPGRSGKGFVLLLAAAVIAGGTPAPLWSVGLFAAPALVACALDLREQVLLGDTGASVLGALAGLVIVQSVAPAGEIVVLSLLLIAAIYGELRSISGLVARTPLLRELDSWGRPS